MDLSRLLERARNSALRRYWLNVGLRRSIPFNKPHGFRVMPLANGGIRVEVPFKRANLNHIHGMHACCLATAAELCSGLALIGSLDPKQYRIIMMSLHMDYHWQAKSRASAVFAPSEKEIDAQLRVPLGSSESCLYVAEVPVHDEGGKHLATGRITWQVKRWDKVRTNV